MPSLASTACTVHDRYYVYLVRNLVIPYSAPAVLSVFTLLLRMQIKVDLVHYNIILRIMRIVLAFMCP